jgi:elongation factor Ts
MVASSPFLPSAGLISSPTVRAFSSSPFLSADKPSVSQIAALRKQRPVPLTLAREALSSSGNDLSRAIAYLDNNSAHSSKKAEKVSGRATDEGVIATSLLRGKRVGMVHLGCETDFVARNEVFLKTARAIAGTAAFLDVPEADPEGPKPGQDPILDFPTSALLSAPLIALPPEGPDAPSTPIPTTDVTTVQQTLLASLGQTGENLKLLRAISFAAPFPSSPLIRYVPGAYAHGGPTPAEGKVGGLVVLSVESAEAETPMATRIHGPGGDELEKDLLALARTVARQVVGFPTQAIRKGDRPLADEEVLEEQPGMMFASENKVGEVLAEWAKERGLKVNVVGMRRWAVADALDGAESAVGPGGAAEGAATEDGA